jgi:hypothetical protein
VAEETEADESYGRGLITGMRTRNLALLERASNKSPSLAVLFLVFCYTVLVNLLIKLCFTRQKFSQKDLFGRTITGGDNIL